MVVEWILDNIIWIWLSIGAFLVIYWRWIRQHSKQTSVSEDAHDLIEQASQLEKQALKTYDIGRSAKRTNNVQLLKSSIRAISTYIDEVEAIMSKLEKLAFGTRSVEQIRATIERLKRELEDSQ